MKTFCQKSKYVIFALVLAGCFLFLNLSCGLDEYYVLDSPHLLYYSPTVSENIQSEYTSNFFSFATNESNMSYYINNSNSNFTFEGTEIYYKIYNNFSQYESEYKTLNNLSISENYSSAAQKIKDYNFLTLKCENYHNRPLIVATGSNRRVDIRLTDYGSEPDWAARIEVDGKPITGAGKSSSPRRNGVVGNYSFNFGRSDEDANLNRIPGSDDADTKYDSSKGDFFYVSLYAVGIGHDANYTQYYSNILHLGAVTIDANSKDN